MVQWELRYRAPRSVDNVLIETFTEQEEEATALAQKYLDSMATPNLRFIYVRKIVVAASRKHADLVAAYGPKGTKVEKPAAAHDEDEDDSAPVAAAASRSSSPSASDDASGGARRRSDTPAGRIGA